ncbi:MULTISPECIES: hypothetical protein [Photorhabdus]|uniref:Transposase n=2 Tax=Photorhabdus TaxID=29487 RepID=A0ABX0AZD2_9GAMM|nr:MULTISPECIES: hypothetical protein [Photorhabdus]MCC8372752.1 hypothetical protein [Photorhabdus bodei]MCC8463113.1 hypothetical protein [Photorhabdus bodei]MCT8352663.1 hypothetical protein [Photorhabdus kayaii]MDB6366791.1 hypothetical protein [Photorhabdus bodei]MDB6374376.1 hypothetical protein [Photorhabdus bodei]
MTGVSECSQQRGNLKDNGYRNLIIKERIIWMLISCKVRKVALEEIF